MRWFRGGAGESYSGVSKRTNSSTRTRLVAFRNALRGTFTLMNAHFAERGQLEFEKPELFGREFLTRFDAIFTLNQDLLLELLYATPMPLARPHELNSINFPGMVPHGDWMHDPLVVWTPSGDFAQPHHCSCIKMHGSTNWFERQRELPIMILGDAQNGAIDASPVLRFYRDEFLLVLRCEAPS